MMEHLTRSKKLFEKAQKLTPGGVHSPVRSLQHVGISPVFFSYGEGAHLYDVDGKSYIDFCQSFGPHILGHCPAPVVRTLREQVDKATSFGACHPLEVELSEKILRAYPFLDKVRLLNSGTEAVMTALRIARGATGKSKVIKFDGCYHGHLDAMLAKAGSGVAELSESSSKGVSPAQVSDTLILPFEDLKAFEQALKQNASEIAAVILEPIPANCGLFIPSAEHLREMVGLAKAHNVLVIFDEVISGFRFSESGACGLFDLQPDIVTLGKIIGGGLPLAAVAAKLPLMDQLAPLGEVYQAGTLSGNPLATAAGCAVLDILHSDSPYRRLEHLTKEFTVALETILSAAGPFQVTQLGSVFWIYCGKPTGFPAAMPKESYLAYGELFRKALSNGLYLPPSPYEVGFVSVAHTQAVLETALDKFKKCVD